MLNVAQRVHNLLKQDGVQTSVEIYFIADTVDCTDDTAVKASQTVLTGQDIEMNGGCAWTEMHNREEDFEVGEAVSSTFSVTLENSDGHLNNFAFGRCKVYANLYDSDNDEWTPVPMGVYVMNTPVKRRVSPIQATAYDQMVLFDKDASDWWDALDFTNGLTLSDILTSLATYCGVSVKNASSITNGTYSYTEKPFGASEMTCRDVLAWIAGAAAGNARFDRNGYLEIKQFAAVDYSIDYTTSPTICLEYDIAEYSTPLITRLQVAQSDSDIGAIIGNDDTTSYRMIGNGFMRGDSVASVTERATPIYNALVGIGTFTPIQTRVYADITVEAGDIITFGGYRLPIFQQMLDWHGGRFQSTIMSSGNAVRPEMPYAVRMNYKEQKEFYISLSEKVGGSEIIAKINLSPEEAKIIANKISLIGYVTVNNGFAIDTDGKMTANGATINGEFYSTTTDSDDNTIETSIANGNITMLRNRARAISIIPDESPSISVGDSRGRSAVQISGSALNSANQSWGDIYLNYYDSISNLPKYQTHISGTDGFEIYQISGATQTLLSKLTGVGLQIGSSTLSEAGLEKLNGIGTVETATPAIVSHATGAWKMLASIALTKGRWLISYAARWNTNSNGRRKTVFSESQDSNVSLGMIADDTRFATNSDVTFCRAVFTVNVTANSATYYLNGYQDSGSAVNAYGRICAVKLT